MRAPARVGGGRTGAEGGAGGGKGEAGAAERAVAGHVEAGAVLGDICRFAEQGYSELVVVCWDRHLLLARISGALAAQGINILSADLYQRGDNLVLDIFRVCNTNFAAVTNKSAKQRVEVAVRDAFLQQGFDFAPAIAASRKALPGFDEVMDEIPQRVFINNDISPDQTVAELQLVDRLGLLYDIFMAIGKLGHNVTHARISTEKGVAIDAIYIQTANGGKIREKEALEELKSVLETALLPLPTQT